LVKNLSAVFDYVDELFCCGTDPVGLLGSDPGPVLVAALAGGPLHEPVELTFGVPTVVPALAAATLALVWR
jgi:hypothetical protein